MDDEPVLKYSIQSRAKVKTPIAGTQSIETALRLKRNKPELIRCSITDLPASKLTESFKRFLTNKYLASESSSDSTVPLTKLLSGALLNNYKQLLSDAWYHSCSSSYLICYCYCYRDYLRYVCDYYKSLRRFLRFLLTLSVVSH